MRAIYGIAQESYERIHIRLEQSGSDREIILDIRKGAHFVHKEPLFLGISMTLISQMAFWAEDPQGNYLEPLYVTKKAATGM